MESYDNSTGSIGDIWHGSILRGLVHNKTDGIILSLTCNTDGAAIYKSNGISIWPIQLCQNSLPPDIRYKNENLLTVGLYAGRQAPDMKMYFYTLCMEFEYLKASPIVYAHEDRQYFF